MDALSSGSRIGNSLSEALGLVSPSPDRVAQDRWQQADVRRAEANAQDQVVSASRIAAAERAGEAGELHPRGRFLNIRV